jgi:hypothetical protein
MRDNKKSLPNGAGAGSVLSMVSGLSSIVPSENLGTSSPIAKCLVEKTLGAQNLTGAKSWLIGGVFYPC